MKLNELLREDAYDDAVSGEESQHASGNLGYALSDMADQELMKIADDPVGYFSQNGEQANPQKAEMIGRMLQDTDDRTLSLIANSPMVQRAIESNYNQEADASFIDIDTMLEIAQKVFARE